MKHLTLLSLAVFSAQLSSQVKAQGSLTPPAGPPVASMKTLDQVEARTAVQSLSATAPYTITQPGSYYLTGNITVASGSAIIVASDDVSLDLNGFTIRSTQTGASSGAAVGSSKFIHRLTVRNGSIVSGGVATNGTFAHAGFAYGIADAFNQFIDCLVTDVHISGVGYYGIYLDQGGVVERCTVKDGGQRGIHADVISNCTVTNYAVLGMHANAAVSNCSAEGYSGVGISCDGNASNCTGSSNTDFGITCGKNAINCHGQSASGTGLRAAGSAENCGGTSGSGVGLNCAVASNCTAQSNTGAQAMSVTGTASFCRASRTGGIAIQAAIAIGCTAGAGTISAPQKHLGTP